MGAKWSKEGGVPEASFDISSLPEELFVQVLVFVPAPDLVKRCSLVSKHWRRVARDQSLWRRKCEQEGMYVPGVMGPPPDDFIVYYFRNPYTRNLLKNCLAESMAHWSVSQYRGHAPKVEISPAGADPIASHVPPEEIGGKKVQHWVTSYMLGGMTQVVRLLDEGCSKAVLDDLRPPIHVSAWCAARWDCGSRFQLKARLLDSKMKEVDSMEIDKELVDAALRRIWHKVEHTFQDYKPGVRFVEVSMSGVDTQFWAGHYGSKFTLPSLRFIFK